MDINHFKQLPLSELLSIMLSSAATGVLEVGSESEVGQIFARAGRLTHAAIHDISGVAALERMAELREAHYHFVGGIKASEETLWGESWLAVDIITRHELLMQQINAHVPSLTWVPSLRAEGGRHGVRLPTAAWPIIASLDGQRSIADVAASLGYDRSNVAVAICWLAKRGLVVLRPPRREQGQKIEWKREKRQEPAHMYV